MKFFWKIFFSIMIITSIACGIGSFVLINSQFNSGLKREIEAIYDELDIIEYTLINEIKYVENYQLETDKILVVANRSAITTSKGKVLFRISDQDKKVIFDSTEHFVNKDFFSNFDNSKKGYEILKKKDKYYIHAFAPLTLTDNQLYIENYYDISQLFQTKNEQYASYTLIMIILVFVVAIISLFTSKIILKPLQKLSLALNEISSGRYDLRLDYEANDEIGQLSQDFNKMAEKLEVNVKELKEHNHRQATFINNFTHELKTPLTSMIGYADMLRSKKLSDTVVMSASNYIFDEGKRLEALSMKLMDMIILDQIELEYQKVSATLFFDSIKKIYAPVLENAHISLSFSIDEYIMQIDKDLFKTVLINLIDNAIKAVDEGGKIIVEATQIEEAYRISIKDNGQGIAKEELIKITEPFYMVDKSRARKGGGAGLGLALCKKIIEKHNANIEFISEENVGTEVIITLGGSDHE